MDEIGELSLPIQVKLLRAIQERTFKPVGGSEDLSVDIRIIAATNKEVEKEVIAGNFREDLFYRLNVIPILLPPLRKRRNDIPLLARYFLRRFALEQNKEIQDFSSEAMRLLLDYPWPGNVRELRNAIEYAFVLCSGNWINKEHLPPKITANNKRPLTNHHRSSTSWEEERKKLIDTLRRVKGNQSEAARILGVSRVTIWKRIKKYGIDLETDLTKNAAAQIQARSFE